MEWWNHPAFIWLASAAAIATAWSVLWGKGLVPMWRGFRRFLKAVHRFADSVDVLFEIAAEFKPNGGTSLHDRIARIEDMVKDGLEAAAVDRAEIKRQVELVITEELPIITALAEHIMDGDSHRPSPPV